MSTFYKTKEESQSQSILITHDCHCLEKNEPAEQNENLHKRGDPKYRSGFCVSKLDKLKPLKKRACWASSCDF